MLTSKKLCACNYVVTSAVPVPSSYSEIKRVQITVRSYLFTPWCRVLLEKLTGLQLVKKFPAFHGTRRFITALTSVRQLSLSWASPIQSIYPHSTSWRSIVILSTHLRLGLPSGLLPSGFPTKTLYTPSPHPYAPNIIRKIVHQVGFICKTVKFRFWNGCRKKFLQNAMRKPFIVSLCYFWHNLYSTAF